jgi:hypothetical protein
MKATTPTGKLQPIEKCYIIIPNSMGKDAKIIMDNLPDISDSKSASYTDETAIGRSSPYKNYGYSENRSISMTIHFIVSGPGDTVANLERLRLIESAVYPRDSADQGMPFKPPPVCRIRCGDLLAKEDLCVILKSYSVKFPTDVSLDETNFCPFKFDVETTWEAVYKSSELPGQENIIDLGTSRRA